MTKILLTVPFGESVQLKRMLVGLGIKEMLVSEVNGSGRGAASEISQPSLTPGSIRPKMRIEIVAPDIQVEPIVHALLWRKKTAAIG